MYWPHSCRKNEFSYHQPHLWVYAWTTRWYIQLLGSAWVFHCATRIHAAIVVPWWTNGPPTASAATKSRAAFPVMQLLTTSLRDPWQRHRSLQCWSLRALQVRRQETQWGYNHPLKVRMHPCLGCHMHIRYLCCVASGPGREGGRGCSSIGGGEEESKVP